jgi:hypothetical protein
MSDFFWDPITKQRAADPLHAYKGTLPVLAQPLNLSAEPIKVDLTGGQAVSVALTPGPM